MVVLEVLIDSDGAVKDARVLESVGKELDDRAVTNMRQARFRPALGEDGKPVKSAIRWRYVFEETMTDRQEQ